MDIKFGKVKSKANFFTQSSSEIPDVNIFSTSGFESQQSNKQTQPGLRLNDYDSNILENNAYQVITDETFRLEHKIGLLEDSLTKINNEIHMMESFGNSTQVLELKTRKFKLEEELNELQAKYSGLNLSTKITGQIASAVNFASSSKNGFFTRLKRFFSKKILARISKKISYSQNMKEALESLSDINTSVDELIQMQTPYGETINRYEKLTAYLNKANLIHSKISANMDDLANKNKRA